MYIKFIENGEKIAESFNYETPPRVGESILLLFPNPESQYGNPIRKRYLIENIEHQIAVSQYPFGGNVMVIQVVLEEVLN